MGDLEEFKLSGSLYAVGRVANNAGNSTFRLTNLWVRIGHEDTGEDVEVKHLISEGSIKQVETIVNQGLEKGSRGEVYNGK